MGNNLQLSIQFVAWILNYLMAAKSIQKPQIYTNNKTGGRKFHL